MTATMNTSKIFLALLFFILSIEGKSQKNSEFRLFILPGIASGKQMNIEINDQLITRRVVKGINSFSIGAGFEYVKKIHKFQIGTNLKLLWGGEFKLYETIYQNGELRGTGYSSTSPVFLLNEWFIEKNQKIGKLVFVYSGGGYWGSTQTIAEFGEGDFDSYDYGLNFRTGLNHKRLFYKIDFQKGLKKLSNKANFEHRTAVVSLMVGFAFNSRKSKKKM